MADQDLETRRARDLGRYHRRTAERRAQGRVYSGPARCAPRGITTVRRVHPVA